MSEDILVEEFQESFILAIEEIPVEQRYKDIVMLRYGLKDGENYLLQDIGNMYNLSRERVRQIIEKIINKIRIRSKKESNYLCYIFVKQIEDFVGEKEDVIYNIGLLALKLENRLLVHVFCKLLFPTNIFRRKETDSLSVFHTLKNEMIEKEIHNRKQINSFKKLFKDVIWQEKRTLIDFDKFKEISAKRNVNEFGSGISGSFLSVKNNRTIEYESNLEYLFCLGLEDIDRVRGYIHQPVKIKYTVNDESFTYFPDFLVLLNDGSAVLVEIKPRSKFALDSNLTKFKVLQRYCELKGLGYLILEKNTSISSYLSYKVDEKKEKKFLDYLSQGDLNWTSYKEVRLELDIVYKEFIVMILNNNLKWTLPFRLSKNNSPNDFIQNHIRYMVNCKK